MHNLVVLEFTKEFSHTTSEDFVRDILVDRIGAKKVIIGFNHYFGHNKEGDFDYLHQMGEELGFEVEEIPEQEIQHETVSSTKIRQALLEGYIQKANAYLDHHYLISGKLIKDVHHCDFNDLILYSITIEDDTKLVPPCGIYAVNAQVQNWSSKGLVLIEQNESSGNSIPKEVSLYIFDTKENFEGYGAVISFAKQMCEGIEFKSCEELHMQIVYYKQQIEDLIY